MKYYIKVKRFFQIYSTQIKIWLIVLIKSSVKNIINIHSGFLSSILSYGKPLVEGLCISMMETFEPFTETDIRQLLKMSSNAFCAADSMPTCLVKDIMDVLIS